MRGCITSILNGERIIQQTTGGWNVLSKDVKGSLILTNKRLMVGDSSNSYLLKDIIQVEFLPINVIQITLKDKTIAFMFNKRSIKHGIDQFASIIFDTPFEAGSRQEEVASYTAHWASILTTALLLYGEPIEYREPVYEDKKAWCTHCQKYVTVPHSDIPVWKTKCPICGHGGMTSLSPEDKKKEGEKNRFFG